MGLSGVSPILGKMQVGGVSAFLGGWVGGLLIFIDRQHCSWAEAHCDTGCCHFVHFVPLLAPGGSIGHSKDWTVTLENGPSPSSLRGAVATEGGGGGLPPLLSPA